MINTLTPFILAAGLGTRLRPFTHKTAKPFLPVLGQAQWFWLAAQLKDMGYKKLITNLHYKFDESASEVKSIGDQLEINCIVSNESIQLLGSGGGYKKAFSLTKSDIIFAINGDTLLDLRHEKIEKMLKNAERLTERFDIVMVVIPNRDGQYREIFYTEENALIDNSVSVYQVTDEPFVPGYFFSGVSLMHRRCVDHVTESSFDYSVLLNQSLEAGKVGALVIDDLFWCDVGSPKLWWKSHLEVIDQLCQKGLSFFGPTIEQFLKQQWFTQGTEYLHKFKQQKLFIHHFELFKKYSPGTTHALHYGHEVMPESNRIVYQDQVAPL